MHPRWTAEDALLSIEYIFDTEDERELFPVEKEIGMPHWIFGQCSYEPHPKNPRILAVVCGGVGIRT